MRPNILIPILLVATTLGVYGQVYRHEFITYDDYSYIKNNFDVQQGLTGESIHWAFTTHHQANWHPLTWLSHMADYNLFGLNAGYHHLESALMHLAAALLLYAALVWMTRAPWRSGLVAALFALHPLHVESVAWASERKDVLSGLLAMLVILAYVGYARRTTWQRMGLVMVLLALGLLAKPMLVTLPFALLLLDYWPLGRFNANRPEPDAEASSRALWPTAARLVLEKLPLFALAAASCVITMEVQKSAMAGPWAVSLPHRLANAAVSCVTYIEKMVWPSGLAFFYPYPEEIPAWQWAGATAILVMVTALVIWQIRRRPYLAVGWFWYLGMLVPVIGLVQVGEQAMADRYTYLPLVGLFIAVVWGATDLAAALRLPKPVPAAVAAAVVVALGAAAFVQTGYWRTSETLYRHAIDVTPRNHIAHDSLGNVFLNDRTVNRIDEAIDEFTAAIADNDKYVLAYSNLSHALFLQNRPQEAEAVARHALDIDPMDLRACHNLSMALYKQGRLEEAAETLRDAAGLAPGAAAIHNDLGKVLLDLSEKGSPAAVLDESIDQLRTALACQPIFPMAWRNLAKALLARGRPGDFEEAVSNAELAVAVEPGNPDNQKVLDRAKSGRRSAPAPSINYKH